MARAPAFKECSKSSTEAPCGVTPFGTNVSCDRKWREANGNDLLPRIYVAGTDITVEKARIC
jgi:hypothetical protein